MDQIRAIPYSKNIIVSNTQEMDSHEQLPRELRFCDQRSLLRKIVDTVLAIFRNLTFTLEFVPWRIKTAIKAPLLVEYCDPGKLDTWKHWKQNSSSLHLFSHGFRGHPFIWNSYLKDLREEQDADIRMPFIPKKGNCALEHASKPLRDMVLHYLEEQIQKKENQVIPIHLYGVSNGGRVTLHLLKGLIDEELNERLKAKNLRLAIKVDVIAGILQGTRHWKVQFFDRLRVGRWLAKNFFKVSSDIMNDFPYRSVSTKRFIDTIRKIQNQSHIAITYAFYSSTEDQLIKPYFSSLPILGKGEKHHIVHAEGHNSIVKKVRPLILNSNKEWRARKE